jgi:hypothetical protein
MKVLYWFLNAALAAACIGCFALAFYVGESSANQLGLGMTGLAFGVGCFLFTRHTLQKS